MVEFQKDNRACYLCVWHVNPFGQAEVTLVGLEPPSVIGLMDK